MRTNSRWPTLLAVAVGLGSAGAASAQVKGRTQTGTLWPTPSVLASMQTTSGTSQTTATPGLWQSTKQSNTLKSTSTLTATTAAQVKQLNATLRQINAILQANAMGQVQLTAAQSAQLLTLRQTVTAQLQALNK